jgi:ribonuclease-3
MPFNHSKLEKRIGIKFKNKDLLKEALTHRSYLNERPNLRLKHNERLEFLGDAVLELVVTEYLYRRYPDKPEGELTNFRAALVKATMLYEIASELELDNFLLLSRGEAKDLGKGRQYILANAVEALIGAIYLDKGYKPAKSFVEKNILSQLENVIKEGLLKDAKSLFQEKAQEIVNTTPTYKVLKEWGPDHAKHFVIGVYLGNELVAQGEGSSKQEAEQSAAEAALKKKKW